MIKLNNEQKSLVEENYALIPYMLKQLGLNKDQYSDEYFGALSLGLCKAATVFDSNKGVKFNTFAYKCMTNEVFMLQRSLHRDIRHGFVTVSCYSLVGEKEEDGVLIDFIPDVESLSVIVEESEIIKMYSRS